MFCSNCGKKIRDDARFCPYCGTNVSENDDYNSNVSDDSNAAENSGYTTDHDSIGNTDNTAYNSAPINELFQLDNNRSRIVIGAAIALCVILGIYFLSGGGTPSIKNENEIKDDLVSYSVFADQNLDISSLVINDRKTDKKNKTDEIYCSMEASTTGLQYNYSVTEDVDIGYYCYDQGWSIQHANISNKIIVPVDYPSEDDIISQIYTEESGIDFTIDNTQDIDEYEKDYVVKGTKNCTTYEKDIYYSVAATWNKNNTWSYSVEEGSPSYKVLIDLTGTYSGNSVKVNWADSTLFDKHYSISFSISEDNGNYIIHNVKRVKDDAYHRIKQSPEIQMKRIEEFNSIDIVKNEKVSGLSIIFEQDADFKIEVCIFPDGNIYCYSNNWFKLTKQ